ncbi:helix-turn-helix domain-containing protein [Streptomyces sp. SID8375]|uniref:Helix-turn-helix domain-containing protein n=2 Tax=Streptomyces nigrescens TaxID=1920 RepID=A0A640TDR2_STRNI|nr:MULTISPECIES: helix-turn-helix domain-containing protein [Streptomyces]MYX08112.1 helix-turn-helix domain-containing protein [Streptomyces sp. SID8375]WAT94663.1 helix-turn-helix domain-containing protein [Streptomyces libani subsp. libani]WAU02430.1 helix-turn-helix domain-containing protein [Streptomyces nigrescens]GFE19785.1 transcriptional regulator [Streptomyces libani subsp. libani]GGW04002.1 transcriptional regulator [Streptomyces libani subsp. libani]
MLVSNFSTEMVAAQDRFALWEEFASQSHMRNWMRSEHEDNFRATMRVLDMGDAQISTMTFPSLEVVRTPKLIRQQSDREFYQVNCVLAGAGGASQGDRNTSIRQGQLVLVDSSLPFRGQLHGEAENYAAMIIQLPRELLPLPWKTVQRVSARPISGCQGLGGVLWRWLTEVNARAEEFTPADIPTLRSVTADLLAAVLGRCLDAEDTMTPESRRRALQVQIRDFIRRHLGDPSLSPATIAAAHRISVRYVHQLFAEEGTTAAAWIRGRRLERCRRDLANPHLQLRPIHAIAAQWGFIDPAHFSRAFRAAYGMPPRDYRQHALRGAVRESASALHG